MLNGFALDGTTDFLHVPANACGRIASWKPEQAKPGNGSQEERGQGVQRTEKNG